MPEMTKHQKAWDVSGRAWNNISNLISNLETLENEHSDIFTNFDVSMSEFEMLKQIEDKLHVFHHLVQNGELI